MGASWASSTPLTPVGYAFALALFEVLHLLGGDWAADDRGAMSAALIGRRTRLTPAQARSALAELIDARVAATDEAGAIGCPGWRDAQLSDPARAGRNRRYRERMSETSRETPAETRMETGRAGGETSRPRRSQDAEPSPEREHSESRAERENTPTPPGQGKRAARSKSKTERPPPDPRVLPVLEAIDRERARHGLRPLPPSERHERPILDRIADGIPTAELIRAVELHSAQPDGAGRLTATTPFTGPGSGRPGGWSWSRRLLDQAAAKRPVNGSPRRAVDVTTDEQRATLTRHADPGDDGP
jgi:hypothetical protein